jgi:hypothetical protein
MTSEREILEAVFDEVIGYIQPDEEQHADSIIRGVKRMVSENFQLKREIAQLRDQRYPAHPRKFDKSPTRWNQLEVDP